MKISEVLGEGKTGPGLWANIHAKRERIKSGSGERMRKPGSKGAPTAKNFKDAASEGVAEGQLNEFAPGNGGDDGEEDALLKYAKMWYQGDLKTQQQVEQILDRAGWEIGELESEEGGCFVMRSDDENSYIGFSAEDLQ
jgi:hypothetical protein